MMKIMFSSSESIIKNLLLVALGLTLFSNALAKKESEVVTADGKYVCAVSSECELPKAYKYKCGQCKTNDGSSYPCWCSNSVKHLHEFKIKILGLSHLTGTVHAISEDSRNLQIAADKNVITIKEQGLTRIRKHASTKEWGSGQSTYYITSHNEESDLDALIIFKSGIKGVCRFGLKLKWSYNKVIMPEESEELISDPGCDNGDLIFKSYDPKKNLILLEYK